MANANDAPESELYDFSSDPDGLTREQALGPDWLLDAVQSYIFGEDDEHDAGMLSLTLVVSGTVVRGTLVSRDTWLRDQVSSMPANAAALGEFLSTVVNEVRSNAMERQSKRREAGRPSAAREFLHFKDATISVGGDSVITLPFYRVRVSAVEGWALGS